MTNQASNLPPEVQAVLSEAEAKKAHYLEHRNRLEAIASREEKHRKSVQAAEAEAEHYNQAWKDAFRAQDGELTKEVRAMRAKATEALEIKEEFQALLAEIAPALDLCRHETAQARRHYVEAAFAAKQCYVDHQLVACGKALFTSQEGAAFLQAMKIKKRTISQELENSELSLYMSDESVEAGKKMRYQDLLDDVIAKALRDQPGEPCTDETLASLNPVRKLAGELDKSSPAGLQRARASMG